MAHVYKITSPSKKIYVGSSINIKKRFRQYQLLSCKNQIKLYRSLKKYGISKHKFEIIIECNKEEMLSLEAYYCILYDTLGVNGLNLKIPKFDDVYKCVGKERRNQMSKQLLGNKHRLGKIPWNKGYKHTGDTSNFAPKNPKKLNAQEKLQRSIDVKKVRSTPESRLKTSIASKGGRNANAKKVIQISTGVIFGSLSEAANNANMNKHSLGHYLRGRFYNKTDYRYLNS